MTEAALIAAKLADALVRLEALRNLSHEQTKAVVSLRADLNAAIDVTSVMADRLSELERQVSALQAAIRPRPVS